MKFIKNEVMKKSFLFFVLLMSLMIISCSKKNNDSKESPQRESKYKRIVVMDPAVVEMIYLLGDEDKIVGITKLQRSKIWPEDKTDKHEIVGTITNV